jgi:hypothetical protein
MGKEMSRPSHTVLGSRANAAHHTVKSRKSDPEKLPPVDNALRVPSHYQVVRWVSLPEMTATILERTHAVLSAIDSSNLAKALKAIKPLQTRASIHASRRSHCNGGVEGRTDRGRRLTDLMVRITPASQIGSSR